VNVLLPPLSAQEIAVDGAARRRDLNERVECGESDAGRRPVLFLQRGGAGELLPRRRLHGRGVPLFTTSQRAKACLPPPPPSTGCGGVRALAVESQQGGEGEGGHSLVARSQKTPVPRPPRRARPSPPPSSSRNARAPASSARTKQPLPRRLLFLRLPLLLLLEGGALRNLLPQLQS